MTEGAAGRPGEKDGRSRTVAVGGAGLALAVALPIALHPFGLGPVLLPMHLPVLLTGGLAGPVVGGLVGALAPLLSHLLTGMPPIVPPVAPLMAAELATYGAVAGLAIRPARPRRAVGHRPHLIALAAGLVAAMVTGRVVLALAAAAFGSMLGLRVPALTYLKAAVITGVPGMIAQLVVIPLILSRIPRDAR